MESSIRQQLKWASQELAAVSESPRLDAEILLAHCLDQNRAYLITWPERELDHAQLAHFRNLIERRQQPQPVAYLTGTREFYSLPLRTTPATLVPRPETEMLVDWVLELIADRPDAKVLDMGTGTGAIALAIKQQAPQCRMTATDVSAAALEVARHNAEELGLTVEFIESNWFASIADGRCFDVIASNPPYIAEQDPYLKQGDLPAEPRLALASGRYGLDALQQIIAGANRHLKPGGWLVLEHGYEQEHDVADLLRSSGYLEVETVRDFNDLPRLSRGRKGLPQS